MKDSFEGWAMSRVNKDAELLWTTILETPGWVTVPQLSQETGISISSVRLIVMQWRTSGRLIANKTVTPWQYMASPDGGSDLPGTSEPSEKEKRYAARRSGDRKAKEAVDTETRTCLWCRQVFDSADPFAWVCGPCVRRGHAPGHKPILTNEQIGARRRYERQKHTRVGGSAKGASSPRNH